jgi:hypothetical protein
LTARAVRGLPAAGVCAAVALLAGCATVPQNRRAHFADPMMELTPETLDAARQQKMYDSREGAAGGDGAPSGGGCGCQ